MKSNFRVVVHSHLGSHTLSVSMSLSGVPVCLECQFTWSARCVGFNVWGPFYWFIEQGKLKSGTIKVFESIFQMVWQVLLIKKNMLLSLTVPPFTASPSIRGSNTRSFPPCTRTCRSYMRAWAATTPSTPMSSASKTSSVTWPPSVPSLWWVQQI